MKTRVLALMFLLGFVIEYPINSQECNGRTYTIKGAYNLVEFIEMLKEKTDCKIAYKESASAPGSRRRRSRTSCPDRRHRCPDRHLPRPP